MPRRHSLRRAAFAAASAATLSLAAFSTASAETSAQGGEVVVTAKPYVAPTYAAAPVAPVGPLGARAVLDTPISINTVPEDLIVNVGARTVNDALRYLPSVTIRNQQGYEVSRPQSRGFQGSIVQDTRMDGLNIVGTTANPAEGLQAVQVINGAAGSLYGPQPLAGVFNYMLKRPTDALLLRLVGSYDTQGVFTEQGDVGDRVGPLGYRLNVMHGQGQSWVDFSHVDRTLAQGDFDVRLGQHTVLELGALYSDAYRGLYGITNTLTDNLGNYTVTKNFNAIPHYTIFSNMASLNGHVTVAGLANDVTLGTNGFINGQNTYFNSIAVSLGKGNLANPTVLPTKPTPANGGTYKSGRLQIQSLIAGDEIHFTPQFSLMGVLSTAFLNSESWAKTGALTSSDSESWVWSPTVSLIYKPMANVSVYATYANSVEQGEQAPAGTANANAFLEPYRDEDYEGGVKYAPSADFLVTAGVFHMTRPLAQTVAATNVFQVIGTQRDWGLELYGQGSPVPDLSLLGGVTYVNARLEGSMIPGTNDKRVVGVPEWKADLAADFHPLALHGLAFTGALHFESDRAATNVNNSFAPSYATVDLGLRYSASFWGHHETARFQVMNVGDTRYYTAIADGNIVGSPGANTAYIAPPRTVMASLEFDY